VLSTAPPLDPATVLRRCVRTCHPWLRRTFTVAVPSCPVPPVSRIRCSVCIRVPSFFDDRSDVQRDATPRCRVAGAGTYCPGDSSDPWGRGSLSPLLFTGLAPDTAPSAGASRGSLCRR
jgi:hypothetical protein